MMGSYEVTGFAIAALSAFFNGSFPAWSKLSKENVDDVVFNGIVGLGAFLSSLIVPLIWGEAYVFSVAAMVGGILFICATLCTFIAIPKIGLGTACATWSCVAIFVSFLWGVLGPRQVQADVKNIPLSILALMCLALGAVVIVSAEVLAAKVWGSQKTMPLTTSDVEDVVRGAGERMVGLMFAAATGVFGGSILVPMHFVPATISNIQTVLSFGIGAGIMAVVTTFGYWKLVAQKSGLPCVQPRTLLAGILAGATWNAGNVCQIVVQSPPISLAYGIAYPMGQCGMFFAGLWGIFVFNEIKGKAVLVFWAGAAVLAVGVILLGLFGPGA